MTDPWPLRSSLEVRDSDPRPPQTKATNDDGASDPADGVLRTWTSCAASATT
jgi:hypothetical protein